MDDLPIFLRVRMEDLLAGPRPFAEYMRARFRDKGVLQQNVFLAADISENYGYKIIAEEKHTVQRDIILRICLAAQFDRKRSITTRSQNPAPAVVCDSRCWVQSDQIVLPLKRRLHSRMPWKQFVQHCVGWSFAEIW